MAELADAQDLKSCGTNLPCRFDSGLRHLREKGISVFTEIPFFVTLYTEEQNKPNCNCSVPSQLRAKIH